MRTVKVVEYDPTWPELFAAECELLRRTLGGVVLAIHHIGSTAVPGLAAKPIIDMLMEVADLGALDAVSARMVSIGYAPKGEFGIPGRRYFPKGGDSRTHHLHAFASGDPGLVRHIAFRDYLRVHPEVAQEYGRLKKAIAGSGDIDPARYCDAKDAYVKALEATAIKKETPNHSPEPTSGLRPAVAHL